MQLSLFHVLKSGLSEASCSCVPSQADAKQGRHHAVAGKEAFFLLRRGQEDSIEIREGSSCLLRPSRRRGQILRQIDRFSPAENDEWFLLAAARRRRRRRRRRSDCAICWAKARAVAFCHQDVCEAAAKERRNVIALPNPIGAAFIYRYYYVVHSLDKRRDLTHSGTNFSFCSGAKTAASGL